MVLWGNYSDFSDSNFYRNPPGFYKGWYVSFNGKQDDTTKKLVLSFKELFSQLQEDLSVDTVTLLLPLADKLNLGVYATIGLEEEIKQQIHIPIGKGIAGRIASSMKPMTIANLSEVEISSPILRDSGLRSLAGVPVPIEEGVTGVLHVATFRSNQFTDRDIQLLQQISAGSLKEMIQNAELFKSEMRRDRRKDLLSAFGLKVPSFNIRLNFPPYLLRMA